MRKSEDAGVEIVLARLMRAAGPALDDDEWWHMGSTRQPSKPSFVAELTDGKEVIRYRVTVERLETSATVSEVYEGG